MLKAFARVAAVAALVVVTVSSGRAQTPQEAEALQKQLDALAAGQKAIEQQLQEIRTLLQGQGRPAARTPPTPADMQLNVDGAPSKGPSTARVTIIEFSDYECPFCTRGIPVRRGRSSRLSTSQPAR